MDLIGLFRVLRRRWYIALPLVLVAVLASMLVRAQVQPGYAVGASVIVLPPGAAAVAGEGGPEVVEVNPLLTFNSSTQVAARALALLAGAPDFQTRVGGDSPLAAYAVTTTERDPILQVAVESKDRERALGVAQQVIDELQVELDRQQPVARPEQRLSLQVLAPPSVAAVDDSRLRAAVVALAVGLVAAIGITVLLDGMVGARARHSTSRAATGASTYSDKAGSGDLGLGEPVGEVAPHGAVDAAAARRPTPTAHGEAARNQPT